MVATRSKPTGVNWCKTIGMVIVLIPIGLLLVLGIGEMTGGILSGLQHFVQLLPMALLAIFAWNRPQLGGAILVGIGTLLAALYPFLMGGRFPAWVLLINDLILFGPAIAAGILFLAAARHEGVR